MPSVEKTNSAPVMKSVDRAISLLSYFTVAVPEWGLSDLARKAELDKATTLRILVALMRNRFVEQHPLTKKYRLGIAVLHLARVREESFPLIQLIKPILDKMSEAIGETVHATLAADEAMMTVAVTEPMRSARVWVDPSQPLPFHATASGLAYLAFAQPHIGEKVLQMRELPKFTHSTITPAELKEKLETVRAEGFASSLGSFEAETAGIAAPFFSSDGYAIGAVAIAGIVSRMTEDLVGKSRHLVLKAAIDITRAIGGTPHNQVLLAARSA